MLSKHLHFVKAAIFTFVLFTCVVGGFFVLFHPKVHGLQGVYYNNPTWQGKSYMTSIDVDISTKILKKQQREQLPQNRFSVEWTGYITTWKVLDKIGSFGGYGR